ncbi:MAG: hypothetical protein FD137_1793 [Spirochaetes bacterium]|nr:MAG: hypothetical protein FD137_1793 [Spirochaetota bacterium]
MKSRFWLILALLAGFCGIQAFAASSSCVDCHGNADLMKTMVSPPVVNAEEGEG